MGIEELHEDASLKFASTLRQLINKFYGSNRRLAKISGLAESTIRKLQSPSSNPTLETLSRLALCFNIDIKDFFSSVPLNGAAKQEQILENEILENNSSIQDNLAKRLRTLLDYRKIDPSTLSILAYEIDYSSTIKYIKVKENVELRTLLKIAEGLEVSIYILFDFDGSMPTNIFKGRMKEN